MESIKCIHKSCDILVIGGGGAGLVAAAHAAYLSDLKVIVLEKTPITGGAALFASTLHTFRSQWQAKRGIPDKMDEYFRRSMDATMWRLDPQLVQNCYLATGRFFDWFCGISGEPMADRFMPRPYVFDGPDGQLGPDLIGGYCHRGSGLVIMQALRDYCVERGVTILKWHRAMELEPHKNGGFTVAVQSPKGAVFIHCKNCVIASGSLVSNTELMEKAEPRFAGVAGDIDASCMPHVRDIYTGDGIFLAEKAGAKIDYENMCVRMLGPCMLSDSEVLNQMGSSPYGINVNLHGKRWSCEPVQRRVGLFRAGHMMLNQPRGLTYHIFDESNLEAAVLASNQQSQSDGGFFGKLTFPSTEEELRANMDKSIQKADGQSFCADTIQELAEKIGVDPHALEDTIDCYNQGCKSGEDLMHKDPSQLVPIAKGPYYAVRGKIGCDGAFGGLTVDPNMRVYAEDGSVIKGLYAAGDICSSRFIKVGDFKEQVINDCSWAFASGFLAAEDIYQRHI